MKVLIAHFRSAPTRDRNPARDIRERGEVDLDETRRMMRNLFERMQEFSNENELKRAFELCSASLKDGLDKAFWEFSPDMVFVHSRNKRALGEKGIAAEIIHDTMDFDDQLDFGTRASLRAKLRTSGEQYREITKNNIEMGRRHFGFDVLRAHLSDALDWSK